MSDRINLWIVIAAYNEETVIGDVVGRLRTARYQVVVVDDGSRDNTADAAYAAGAAVLRHSINLGQGAGLQTGIDYAVNRGADVVVTFDGDGQHSVSDIPRMVAALHDNNAEFALGSRFLGRSVNQPWLRRATLKLATLFTRLTVDLAVTDTHNGFRAMTRRGAKAIQLRQNRMAHASEILHQIAESGLRFVEVPVTIEYSAYSIAKGQRLGDAFSILLDLFARRLHR